MKESLGIDVLAGHPGMEEDLPRGRPVAGLDVQHAGDKLLAKKR